jgi:uncharacterized protein (DUF2267 family)
MEFRDLMKAVNELAFVKDEVMAEAAVKAVLGVLASRLEEEVAKEFVESLPEPFDFEALRGEQADVTDLSVQQYRNTIADQFHLERDDAWQLVRTVLYMVRDGFSDEVIEDLQDTLPSDWQRLLQI